MKVRWPQWLKEKTPAAGVMAAAVVLPDGQLYAQANASTLSSSQWEQSARILATAYRQITASHFSSPQFRWHFEQLQVQGQCRPDGALLLLIMGNDRAPAATAAQQQLIRDFLQAGTAQPGFPGETD